MMLSNNRGGTRNSISRIPKPSSAFRYSTGVVVHDEAVESSKHDIKAHPTGIPSPSARKSLTTKTATTAAAATNAVESSKHDIKVQPTGIPSPFTKKSFTTTTSATATATPATTTTTTTKTNTKASGTTKLPTPTTTPPPPPTTARRISTGTVKPKTAVKQTRSIPENAMITTAAAAKARTTKATQPKKTTSAKRVSATKPITKKITATKVTATTTTTTTTTKATTTKPKSATRKISVTNKTPAKFPTATKTTLLRNAAAKKVSATSSTTTKTPTRSVRTPLTTRTSVSAKTTAAQRARSIAPKHTKTTNDNNTTTPKKPKVSTTTASGQIVEHVKEYNTTTEEKTKHKLDGESDRTFATATTATATISTAACSPEPSPYSLGNETNHRTTGAVDIAEVVSMKNGETNLESNANETKEEIKPYDELDRTETTAARIEKSMSITETASTASTVDIQNIPHNKHESNAKESVKWDEEATTKLEEESKVTMAAFISPPAEPTGPRRLLYKDLDAMEPIATKPTMESTPNREQKLEEKKEIETETSAIFSPVTVVTHTLTDPSETSSKTQPSDKMTVHQVSPTPKPPLDNHGDNETTNYEIERIKFQYEKEKEDLVKQLASAREESVYFLGLEKEHSDLRFQLLLKQKQLRDCNKNLRSTINFTKAQRDYFLYLAEEAGVDILENSITKYFDIDQYMPPEEWLLANQHLYRLEDDKEEDNEKDSQHDDDDYDDEDEDEGKGSNQYNKEQLELLQNFFSIINSKIDGTKEQKALETDKDGSQCVTRSLLHNNHDNYDPLEPKQSSQKQKDVEKYLLQQIQQLQKSAQSEQDRIKDLKEQFKIEKHNLQMLLQKNEHEFSEYKFQSERTIAQLHSKYDNMKQQRQYDNSMTQMHLNSLIEETKIELDELKEQNEQLRSIRQCTTGNSDNAINYNDNDDLQSKYDAIQEECVQLKQQNGQLLQLRHALKKDFNDLEMKFTIVQRERDQLQIQLLKLKQQLLRDKYHAGNNHTSTTHDGDDHDTDNDTHHSKTSLDINQHKEIFITDHHNFEQKLKCASSEKDRLILLRGEMECSLKKAQVALKHIIEKQHHRRSNAVT